MMVLRYIFGDASLRPRHPHATLTIDDPLLRHRYGYLSYQRLLSLMDTHGFHASIAFIPYNHSRSSPDVARMFADRSDRFSLCYHGNDHTGAEFGIEPLDRLNTMLHVAARRMESHRQMTGIHHENVMVFPQGIFSANAMRALKLNDFVAAVNSDAWPPDGNSIGLRIRDLIQPAIVKYDGFPLFLRRDIPDYTPQEIAFHHLLGKPVLICAHHDSFKDSRLVTDLVSSIRSVAPQIRWSSLEKAVENSWLHRRAEDGSLRVLAYASRGEIQNELKTHVHCVLEKREGDPSDVKQVLVDGQPWPFHVVSNTHIQTSFELNPGDSRTFRVVYANRLGLPAERSDIRRSARVFLRRRLSEIRDNYLSKHPALLATTQALRRYLVKSS